MREQPLSRDDLLEICRRSIVNVHRWGNTLDSGYAQTQIGRCWALLSAGCDFRIMTAQQGDPSVWCTQALRIGVEVDVRIAGTVDSCEEVFLLPTRRVLNVANGGDWLYVTRADLFENPTDKQPRETP